MESMTTCVGSIVRLKRDECNDEGKDPVDVDEDVDVVVVEEEEGVIAADRDDG